MIALLGIAASLLGFALLLLAIPLAFATFAFWVWMLVEAIRNDRLSGTERALWAVLMWFAPVIGSLLYFFLIRRAGPRLALA